MRRICITLRQVPFKGPKKAASASPVDIFLPCPALPCGHTCASASTKASLERGPKWEQRGGEGDFVPEDRWEGLPPPPPRGSWPRAGVPQEAQAGEGEAHCPPAPFGPCTPSGPAPPPCSWPLQPLLQLILHRLLLNVHRIQTLGTQPEDATPSVACTGLEGTLGDPGLGARLQCWAPRRGQSRPPPDSVHWEAGAHKSVPEIVVARPKLG